MKGFPVKAFEAAATSSPNEVGRWRRWASPQSLRAGLGSGLLGGVCCIGAAVTTAAALGTAGFFTTLMDRYQVYFILASIALMVLWLARQLRRQGASLKSLRAIGSAVGKQAMVMGVVYAATLGLTLGVAQLIAM